MPGNYRLIKTVLTECWQESPLMKSGTIHVRLDSVPAICIRPLYTVVTKHLALCTPGAIRRRMGNGL